jgi:hypothetical protein
MSGYAALASLFFCLSRLGWIGLGKLAILISNFFLAFLFIVGVTFYGIWIGSQKHAEEIYINNSVDKNLITETDKLIKLGEHIATAIGAVFSLFFLLVSLDSFTDTNVLAK